MTAGQSVRAGSRADIPAAVAVLARAFADKDPFTWIQPDPVVRARLMPAMFDAALSLLYPIEKGGEVHLGTAGVDGVAMWTPPGRWKPTLVPQLLALPRMVRALGFGGLRLYAVRGKAVEDALYAEHPGAPHWYLAGVGVDPAAHGRGIGSALLDSGLRRCDSQNQPAYLECLEALVPYYERFGFLATRSIAMPEGASKQVGMWREPRSSFPI